MLAHDLKPFAPWLGGHGQTIWAAKCARSDLHSVSQQRWQRERWSTPDGDFIDVDTLRGDAGAPHVVMFHGLEGSSSSHYAKAWAFATRQRGWTMRVVHFRGCSGEINRMPRAYHSGDALELDWVLRKAHEQASGSKLYGVGISLGGNALVKWLGTLGLASHAPRLSAAAALAAPLDLKAAGLAIEQGLNRWLYTPMFLRTMRIKAEQKWLQYPGLFDLERVRRVRTIREFDDAFTAPLHGFTSVWDYWAKASAKPQLANITTPTWVINAENDPFVPVTSIVSELQPSPHVRVFQPRDGGHAGFAHRDGSWRGVTWHLPTALLEAFSSAE